MCCYKCIYHTVITWLIVMSTHTSPCGVSKEGLSEATAVKYCINARWASESIWVSFRSLKTTTCVIMNSMVSRENVVIIKMTKHTDECSPEARIHTYTHMKSQKKDTHTHARTQTHTHRDTHTHTHTHTHTCTHTLRREFFKYFLWVY